MRRTMVVIALLGLSALLSGCYRNTANANNVERDDATTSDGQQPRHGSDRRASPEPEKAGSVSKGANSTRPRRRIVTKR